MPLASRRRRVLAGAGALALAIGLVPFGPQVAGAQTQTVNDATALRAAIVADVPTIVLGANIALTCPDNATDAALQVDYPLTLQAPSGTERTLSLGAGCSDRLIEVTGNHRLTIERLHLTGGRAPAGANGDDGTDESVDGTDGAAGGHGGAIISGGPVVVNNARFSSNWAGDGGNGGDGFSPTGTDSLAGGNGGHGGAGGRGGAIHTTDTITVTNSTFDDNRAGKGGNGGLGGNGSDGADGVAADGDDPGSDATAGGAGGTGGDGGEGGRGGALAATGNVVVTRSTLNANRAGAGGDGADGGTGGNGGASILVNDVEGGNRGAGGNGGAAGNGGDGGAAWSAGTISANTSTIDANTTGAAGTPGSAGEAGEDGALIDDTDDPDEATAGDPAIVGAGGAFAGNGLTVTLSTVTANTAGTPGADAERSLSSGGTIALHHSVVAGSGEGVDCLAAAAITSTNSIAGNNSCTGAEVVALADLGLGALAANGGPTRTRMPAATSPVVDKGASACPTETTDQRGVTRKQGTNCDIGSVERQGAVAATVAGVAGETAPEVGDTVTVTFTVTFANTTVGSVTAEGLVPTITGCTTTPVRGGSAPPWSANAKPTWTCDVTGTTAGTVNVAFSANLVTGEGTTTALTTTVPVAFQAAAASTTTTSTTAVPPVIGSGVGDAGAGNDGLLPRTGLSIFLSLIGGAALLGGGSSLTRYAKVRAVRSPRWGLKYGVPYPAGTTKALRHETEPDNQP